MEGGRTMIHDWDLRSITERNLIRAVVLVIVDSQIAHIWREVVGCGGVGEPLCVGGIVCLKALRGRCLERLVKPMPAFESNVARFLAHLTNRSCVWRSREVRISTSSSISSVGIVAIAETSTIAATLAPPATVTSRGKASSSTALGKIGLRFLSGMYRDVVLKACGLSVYARLMDKQI